MRTAAAQIPVTVQKRRAEFEAAALPHIADLFAVAMRYTRDRDGANDLVQETFLRAYTNWSSFTAGSNCRAWLIRILTNSFINHYRRGRSHRAFTGRSEDEQLTVLYGQERVNPEQAAVDAGFSDEVSDALADLGDDYREVVLLADVEGMKYKDIAERLGCPIGTVMSRLFRARRQLEDRLTPYAASDYGFARAA